MTSTSQQVSALLKKEFLLLIRTQYWWFQEIFSPLFGVYFIWSSTQAGEIGFSMGPLAISLFQSRIMYGLIYGVVFEKSQNYKEYLRVNGASLFSYIWSTFFFYIVRAFIAATILYVGMLYVGAGSKNLFDQVIGYLNLLIYSIAIINFSLMISTLFSSPKLATQAGSLIVLFLNCLYYAIVQSKNPVYYYLGSLLPPVAGSFGFSVASLNEKNPARFNPSHALAMQFLNCFIYFGLYVLLDMVVPSDSGIKDPIWRCPKRARSNVIKENELSSIETATGVNNKPLLDDVQIALPIANNQDVSSAIHHENFSNPSGLKRTVFVDNLTKNFGKTVAVDHTSFPMFERQIFCLLGHNGAGKTTAINMMTGLLRPDTGNIYYDNDDFGRNFEQIRRKFGLCVQKDILYENLTTAEHMELISRLRGVSSEQMQNYIQALSEKVGIKSELDKKSSTLSGGNKRKLSLALAIAGETKVIFLDEPTSGLDPNARRSFWDLVRQLRDEGKTILLTTHNLDEADELADRIGIMSKGKLLILGTSNFLKKKYGVGYNLVLTPKQNTLEEFSANKNRLIGFVRRSIVSSEVDTKTSPDMVKILLPFHESEKFPELFKVLEKESFIEISLELNTLEDVFVNIGLQDEANDAQNSAVSQNTEAITIPTSINQKPSYSFTGQISAMFKRRYYYTFRSRTNFLQILLPLVYVICSTLISAQKSEPVQQVVLFTVFSLIGFMINSVSYTAFFVWEKETKVKYLLRTMGLRPLPYWLGTLLFDLLIISFFGLCLLPAGYFIGLNVMSHTAKNFAYMVLCFGFAILTQSYLFSWIYQKQATVYKFHMVFALLALFYLPMILFFIFVFTSDDINQANSLSVFILSCFISPPIIFFYACFNLAGIPIILNLGNSFWKNLFQYHSFYCGILILQGLFYFLFTYLIELRSLKLSSKQPKLINSTFYSDEIPNPQEIHQEEQRVKDAQNSDSTKVVDLEKIYENGFTALRGISFGIEKKQIFGLLGPNGAGKSTTFNILTGLIPKTKGQVIFNGQELTKLDPEVFQNSGICPQFDALWKQLSVYEHLLIIGKIKGLDKAVVQDSISYYAKVLRMEEHLHKKADQLSGGTKRKLCVANLLIGAPAVQFMDEPSTGMDPLSKRALYDAIVKNLEDRNASILLTTHSMAEAESLCNKIGILINGRFVCLGTLPYLKNRYGSGYKILVVKEKSEEEVYNQAILEAFPNAGKERTNSEIYESYRVATQDFSFEKAFTVMEGLKKRNKISDFNIMNTTLEHVFIQFSRNQVEPLPENGGGTSSSS